VKQTTLIVPGYLGSGPAHWQSWLERQLPDARRVDGIDWNAPNVTRWASAIGQAIDRARHPVWLVAHSFGCLASVLAASIRPGRVAGALLVAPADPVRFSDLGLYSSSGNAQNIAHHFRDIRLDCPGLVVASANYPWINFSTSAYWAQRWGCRLLSLGHAGHINVDSGYGPWPAGLQLLRDMQTGHGAFLVGSIDIQDRLVQCVS
jgi:uncharacterized protein